MDNNTIRDRADMNKNNRMLLAVAILVLIAVVVYGMYSSHLANQMNPNASYNAMGSEATNNTATDNNTANQMAPAVNESVPPANTTTANPPVGTGNPTSAPPANTTTTAPAAPADTAPSSPPMTGTPPSGANPSPSTTAPATNTTTP
jgi:hypothetical protein